MDDCKLFVLGVEDDDHNWLLTEFGQFGKLEEVQICKGKSYAFVTFADRASAESAMQALNGTRVSIKHKDRLRVEFKDPTRRKVDGGVKRKVDGGVKRSEAAVEALGGTSAWDRWWRDCGWGAWGPHHHLPGFPTQSYHNQGNQALCSSAGRPLILCRVWCSTTRWCSTLHRSTSRPPTTTTTLDTALLWCTTTFTGARRSLA
jgi:hypothetical protein